MNQTPAKPRARLISFEGGEGVGKSTQVKRLLQRLADVDITAVSSREPGGTPRAEAVRSFILQGHSEEWGPAAEAILFAAARQDHVRQFIAPNLQADRWVILDRFRDSTRAYQGTTGGVDEAMIAALEDLALDGREPDLTLVLDMDPENAFKRVHERAEADGIPAATDRFEKENLDWHRRLRQAFLDIAENHPERCVVISADRSEREIADAVWAAVKEKFPETAGKMTA